MRAIVRTYAHLVLVEGLRSIARNTGRSLLTVLGITIDIAAVVCVVAIGKAGSDRAEALLHDPCARVDDVNPAAGPRDRPRVLRGGRHRVRVLSCVAGVAARSHRGTPERVKA